MAHEFSHCITRPHHPGPRYIRYLYVGLCVQPSPISFKANNTEKQMRHHHHHRVQLKGGVGGEMAGMMVADSGKHDNLQGGGGSSDIERHD